MMNDMGPSNSLKKSDISVETLIKYFNNKLSSSEEDAIEKLIATDEDFADWVNAIYEGWLEDPENYLNHLYQFKKGFFKKIKEDMGRSAPVIVGMPFLLKLAATVLILALIGIGLSKLFPTHHCDINDFRCHVEQSYGIYREGITSAGNNDIEKNITDFISAYKYGKFEEAISLSDFLEQEDLDLPSALYEELQLCLGISYLYSSDLEESVATFNRLLDNPSDPLSMFKYEGTWYLGLAYLEKGDYEKAKITLTDLVDTYKSFSHHTDYAKKLLKRL